jgi:predicted RNA binding protein YcfA (HicA-like mRNA interferase family)
MPKPPVLKAREICRILETLGFVFVRQRGSHMQYRHRMAVARPFQTIQVAMFHPCFYAKSQKTLARRSMSF